MNHNAKIRQIVIILHCLSDHIKVLVIFMLVVKIKKHDEKMFMQQKEVTYH